MITWRWTGRWSEGDRYYNVQNTEVWTEKKQTKKKLSTQLIPEPPGSSTHLLTNQLWLKPFANDHYLQHTMLYIKEPDRWKQQFEASTKCYKTFKNLTSSEPTAWWRMGRKNYGVKGGGLIAPSTSCKAEEGVRFCIHGYHTPIQPLVAVALVIAILVTLIVTMLMVAVAAILILRAAHAKWLLDGHLLSS